MNEIAEIEKLLRKAPQPRVPAELLEKLLADVVLPRAQTDSVTTSNLRPLFRRWLPALSFTAFFLACAVAIGVQTNVLLELRRENRELQAAVGDLDQLRDRNSKLQKFQIEQQAAEQLRKDNAELERLRNEIAQLRIEMAEFDNLRAQNQQLAAALKSAQTRAAATAPAEPDPIKAQKDKAESQVCVSNLKQIGLGARLWANAHGKVLPPDFLTMKDELNTPKILVCPADHARAKAASWEEFTPANVSYELLAPEAGRSEPPNTVLTRCPIHDHVGLIDGSVQQKRWPRAVQRHGRWLLE